MLHLHRSSRADKLVSALGDVLLSPPVDPMAREVVAVPTRGVERWLAQRLSHRLGASPAGGDGVCANVEFPPPAALLAHVTASVCGPPPGAGPAGTGVIIPRVGEGRVADDPWSPRRCVWPLVQLVDEHMGDSFLWPLAQYLRASSPGGPNGRVRRFGTVRRLAELYDRYCLYRPEMVLAWKARKESAYAVSRPEDVAWQAELWRLLREHLGYPSPAERAEMAPALIISDPARLDLPERLSLFGLTRLAPSQLRVLKAVAEDRDVHLFLLHPSDVLWQRVAGHLPQRPVARLPRARDETAALAHNPLVRSWARDSREMQLVLAGDGVTGGEHHALAEQAAAGAYLPSSDQLPAGEHLSTLLELLQADLRADRAPPGAGPGAGADHRPLVRDEDDSVRVHSCHGAARQVEVVREAVLHLLATDATLEPREVIVMCPDIERFAPLVQATFAAAEPAGAPVLRARLADRSLRQTNPMLGVAAQLLDLAGSRVTGAQVLDLATREPVSRRFNFNQDELSRIEAWLAASGARWGLDAAHRAPWHLGTLETGTWRAALDRLLLGVAMSEQGSRLFGGTLPLDDVSGGEIDLAGRLVELVARLGQVLDALGSPLDPHGWAGALIGGTEHLALPPPDQPWQAEELRSAIEEACGAAGGAPVTLDLVEARELLAGTLRGRPTRANFRTGDMTVCTLVPMRSVPHRVVCLLGLDDGLFPRPAEVGSEDLLLAEPQVGDRDVASEDRQLLLDAVLAAGDHLVITFEGRDQHLNQHRPPSVPISELLDVIDRTVRCAGGRPARETVVVHHPLQPFDPANYEAGRLKVPGPWRFDVPNLEGARALCRPRHPPPPFLQAPLPPLEVATVPLSSLVRFLEHPVRAFLRDRIGLYAGEVPEQLAGSLPVEMSPLERWALGDRLLQACLAGIPPERAVDAERGRGLLPPGPLGGTALAEVMRVVVALIQEAGRWPCWEMPSRPIEVNVALPDGTAVVGTIPGVRGGTILRCVYSKLAPKHRLRAWAQFLALSAAQPELGASALTIGQSEGSLASRPRVSVATLGPLGADGGGRGTAAGQLSALVDLYRRGMREPLPLYCATSAAWAAAQGDLQGPMEAARRQWASSFEDFPGESSEAEHVAVLGEDKAFLELCEERPRADESGTGWDMSEVTRLGRLATRLWAPLLQHEKRRER